MIVSIKVVFPKKDLVKKLGYLMKLSGPVRPTWEKRLVYLSRDSIVIVNPENDKNNGRLHSLGSCEVFPVLIKEYGKEFVFEIVLNGKKKSLIFQAKSLKDRVDWIIAIKFLGQVC
jgi:hypothetical protein